MAKQVEVTVIKNRKTGVTMQVTKDAYEKARVHFNSENWTECTEEEKRSFYGDGLQAGKEKPAPKKTKPKKVKPSAAPAEEAPAEQDKE